MTAKTRTGLNIADATGADDDAAHSQLMRDHRRPGRAEGASIHSMNPPSDDEDPEPADAGIPETLEHPPQQGSPPWVGKPAPTAPPTGEGPDIED